MITVTTKVDLDSGYNLGDLMDFVNAALRSGFTRNSKVYHLEKGYGGDPNRITYPQSIYLEREEKEELTTPQDKV